VSRPLYILVGLGFLCSTVPAGDEGAGSITGPELDSLAKQIEQEAKVWIARKKIGDEVAKRLKTITYDEVSLRLLKRQINKPRKDPVNLYVANRLFEPLLRADKKTIALALPIVKQAHSRLGRFKVFPKRGKARSKSLAIPPDWKPGTNAGTMLRILGRVDRIRDRKVAPELAIARHNEQVGILERTVIKLMAMADISKEDESLREMLKVSEGRGLSTYAEIIAAVRTEAGKMNQERAKLFYETFVSMGNRLRLKRQEYINRSDARIVRDADSNYGTYRGYPGRELLTAANVLATRAKMPAVTVPTQKQVDAEFNRLRLQKQKRPKQQKRTGR